MVRTIIADAMPGLIGWLGGLGVAAFALVFALNSAAAPARFEGTLPAQVPRWLAGPLAGLISAPSAQSVAALRNFGLPAMFLFYCVAVLGSGRLRTRTVFGLVVLAQVISVLGPSPYASDQFIYLEFSRMWGAFGLNPYIDPVFAAPHSGLLYQASYWPGALSPYGPLFTVLLAPFATLPLAAAYWSSRLLILVAMLAAVWLCGACATEIGASRARTLACVGLNPLIIYYCVAGAHNDVLAVLPMLAAMLLLLRARRTAAHSVRDRLTELLGRDGTIFAAGLLIAVGAGVKASVLVSAPALIIATDRRRTAVGGFLVGAAGIWLITVVCFGGYLPALGSQSQFVDSTSFASVIGHLIGLGGETNALRMVFELALALAVALTAWLAWRRPQDAFTYATWAALALDVTLSWQEPWYAVLFLFPVSCSRSRKLRVACGVVALLLLLLYLPDSQWLTGSASPLAVLQYHHLLASQS